jgi:hypothetical protein
LQQGLAVILRAEYGTLTLSTGLSAPFFTALPNLLLHFAARLLLAGSPALLLAAAAGFALRRKDDVVKAAGLGLAGSLLFVLLTRLDVSGWIARSTLESAFVLPAFWLAVGAALCAEAAAPYAEWAGPSLCAALVMAPLYLHGARLDHRDDFSAVDYANNLYRTVPPGAPAVLRGDTGIFAMRLDPRGRDFRAEFDGPVRDAEFFIGVPADRKLYAAGLGLSIKPRPDPWPLYAMRRGKALELDESYARDAAFSYAFAHSQQAKLLESQGKDGTFHALSAAAWGSDDFGVQFSPR